MKYSAVYNTEIPNLAAAHDSKTAYFISRARTTHGDKYGYENTVYINSRLKVEIFCKTCEKSFNQMADHHVRGRGCPSCGKKKAALILKDREISKEEFIARSTSKHGNRYDYGESVFHNTSTKVKIFCREHGEYFWQLPKKHMMGHGCKKCGVDKMTATNRDVLGKSTNKFIDQAKLVHGNDRYRYDRVEYINKNSKVEIGCSVCDSYFLQSPFNHTVRKQGCPSCSSSKGESIIDCILRDYADEFGFTLEREKVLPDCEANLRFDFYIPDLNLAIEYDGEHHYMPVNFSGTNCSDALNRSLEVVQARDAIKDDYCANSGIMLLRIPFDLQDQIPEILECTLTTLLSGGDINSVYSI